MKAAGVGS